MNQILNILRKDVRHLRLEILASLAVLFLFILVEPRTWMTMFSAASNMARIASFLVCASWGILILRLVHAERLAGLNQFWTTRPYEWPKLLAAKALFVVLFVYIPFLLAQFYLLHHAGLSIAANLGPILHNLLLLTCVAVLPLFCVAVVTASFGQAVLTILGILVAFIGLQLAFSYLGSTSAIFGLPRHAPLFLLPLELAIALLFFAAAVLLQYSRRATLKSIAVLAAAAVLLVLTPQLLEGGTAAASGYAAVSDPPASVTIDTSNRQTFSAFPKNPRTAVYAIPLRYADYAPGANLSPEAQRYTLATADGYTWTSDWLDYHTGFSFLAPKDSETSAHTRAFIDIPWRIVPHVVGRPISIRIEFLFSQLASEAPYTYSLPATPHPVPGLGVCALDDGEENIYCRAPFGDFGFATVSAMGSPNPCDASPDTVPIPAPPIPETGFLTGPRRQPGSPLPLISPVMVNELHLYGPHNQPSGHPCPGTPVTFVVRRSKRRIYLATPPATITLNTPPSGGRLGP
jgi:hypothetical protein